MGKDGAMNQKTGHEKLLEQLRADGIRYMFGNPGSSEEGLIDTLSRFPDIQYILALQETIAVAMADGYCRATQQPAVVQLHDGVGLGNGIGMIYQAFRGHAPMVVLTGESGIAYDAMNAQMSANLVDMARPVTKFAARVIHPGSLLRLLRRAIKIAATPPTGPTFLAVPQDILDAPNDELVVPTVVPTTRVAPEPAAIAAAAKILCQAEKPLILMGDGISRSGAQAELAYLAEVLGAGVWGVNSSEVNLPQSHPLYCGLTGHMFGYASAGHVRDADVVVICGTYVFPEVFPSLDSPFKPDAKLIHIDLDAFEIAKNHPVTVGLVSDPKLTLKSLADTVTDLASSSQREAAAHRSQAIGEANRKAMADARAQDEKWRDAVPLHMSAFAQELARRLPKDAIVFDEVLTHSPELTRWLTLDLPGQFFQTRGGSLGVGIPGALGIKLAHPERTVIGLTGDGGSMYTIQALWSAAHHRIGAKFVICNNHSYRLLKLNLQDYWAAQGLKPQDFPASFPNCFDLHEPDLDFVGLARAMGVSGVRVTQPAEIAAAIQTMLDQDGPFLIDLVVDGSVPPPA
jgi:thiamine pyrophosphate-dependent acetolactate synthase large subunit-like protein